MNSINSLTKPSVNLFIETIMLSHLLNPILIATQLEMFTRSNISLVQIGTTFHNCMQ